MPPTQSTDVHERGVAVARVGGYGRSMAETVIERLAGSVPSWGARIAYGDTSTVGGQDVIPVAIVVFGFGAGEGSGESAANDRLPQGKGEGSGGGGGGVSLPIGAYVQGSGGAVFKPNAIALVLAVTPIVIGVVAAVAGAFAMRNAMQVLR